MTTVEPTKTDKLMHDLLDANRVFLSKALTPTGASETEHTKALFLAQCMAAHYAAACAWLLDRLSALAPTADAVAAELAELLEMGEPLADWCGDQWDRYGIEESRP